jgi:hypothetical protein
MGISPGKSGKRELNGYRTVTPHEARGVDPRARRRKALYSHAVNTWSTIATGRLAAVNPAENNFVALPRIPSACTALLNRVSDVVWEKRFNIATAGRREIAQADAVHYEPLPYYAVFKIMQRLALGPQDVFVDVGSGMGRAVCVAASHTIAGVLGVEIDSELNVIAAANAMRMRGRQTPIRLHCQSATEFDYSEATVLWIFNPFGAATMRRVLERLRASWETKPRPLRIAYINATCAHLFAAEPWLEIAEHWEMSAWSRIKTPVKFYRAR